ncbi:MAG TPA: uroporphyrinogen decarboxylase family protein [Bryobacteraceae bacterium]|nr:uroporphyrinogen decarboxylase family protein [Bryobacteraceae bacterium]
MSIPVSVVFNPNWWFRNYDVSFDRPFYFHRETIVRNDVVMRRALYDRFGLGEADPQPRPIAGSRHVAGGFVVPALLGVEIRFSDNQAPWNVPRNLSREEALRLRVPEIESTWPMNEWSALMDGLEKECGRLTGDFNTGGLINTALELRGNDFFLDLLEDPETTDHVFTVIAETQLRVANYVRSRTGTSSVSVNRGILHVDPGLYLHASCSVQMISPSLYERAILPHEQLLAERLTPYGIHHCGNNLHLFAQSYSRLPVRFLDVGWGSDVAACARVFPEAFLNLRLSPVRMLQESSETIRRDTIELLRAAGRTANVGVCCINMDYGTPDANVLAMFRAAAEFPGNARK